MQSKHKLSKSLFIVVHMMLVFKKPKSILVGDIVADGNKNDIKSDGNLSSSGLDSLKSLYTLIELFLMSKFLILITNLNTLMTLVLLAWPNL